MQTKRTRNIFDPNSREPFKLSRSKIEDYMRCPRCFYLDRRLGIGQPPSFPFNLNSAVDHLLKKEFDIYRNLGEPHPLMKEHGIPAIPFQHEMLDQWRENFKGIQVFHQPSNLLITGAVDDLWIDEYGKLIVVDYKATSKNSPIGIDADWQGGYRRQMEIYQWLLRQLGFDVSDKGYFVYCNGRTDRRAFDNRLEFDIDILPYEGETSWISPTLGKIRACLEGQLPARHEECVYCAYRSHAHIHEIEDRAALR